MHMANESPVLVDFGFALAFTVLILAGLWLILRRRARTKAAQGWPIVEARIESSYVTTLSYGRSPTYYRPVLQYSYVVGGERYSSSYFLAGTYFDRDAAAAGGRSWIGERIRVRCDPSDPATSAWLPSEGAPEKAALVSDDTDSSMIDPELNK